jgi:MFS family permease
MSTTSKQLPTLDLTSSPWSPFRHAAFTVMWIATVVSNIGGWMYSAASGWLMTSLDASPLIVSLVQVATTLPLFLFAVPAGALADIVDRRKFLIISETIITIISAIYAAIVWLGAATPVNLLLFTFLIGIGSALTSPAWQSIVPLLVPRPDLNPAVAANSVGVNVSRAGTSIGHGRISDRSPGPGSVPCRPRKPR